VHPEDPSIEILRRAQVGHEQCQVLADHGTDPFGRELLKNAGGIVTESANAHNAETQLDEQRPRAVALDCVPTRKLRPKSRGVEAKAGCEASCLWSQSLAAGTAL
jgi:hypothetical protein